MITIERVSLRLPPGYEGRASSIASALASALLPLSALGSFECAQLRLAPVRIGRHVSDAEIAAMAAAEVLRGVEALKHDR